MTFDPTIFSTKYPTHHTPDDLHLIQTTDDSIMIVNHIGNISTVHTSLPDTYFISKLTLNLIFAGQLCALGLNVVFSTFGCCVQDAKMGQTLGIGH